MKPKMLIKVISAVCAAVVATSCVAVPVGAVRMFSGVKASNTANNDVRDSVCRLNYNFLRCSRYINDAIRTFSDYVNNVDGSDKNKDRLQELRDIDSKIKRFNDFVVNDDGCWVNYVATGSELLLSDVEYLKSRVDEIENYLASREHVISDIETKVEEIDKELQRFYDLRLTF